MPLLQVMLDLSLRLTMLFILPFDYDKNKKFLKSGLDPFAINRNALIAKLSSSWLVPVKSNLN